MSDDTKALHMRFIQLLREQSSLKSPQVIKAFQTVPRHLFLDHIYEQRTGIWQQVSPSLDLIYSDKALVTQTTNNVPTSSSSQPSVMAVMLEVLDLGPRMNVLEIGTGTGYNAALIAHIVGESGQVTTVDINERLIEKARFHIDAQGYENIHMFLADGLNGYQDAGPYDRIIATASYPSVPQTWLEQLQLGGILVMPLQNQLAGGILVLKKTWEGGAFGSFLDLHHVSFMPLVPRIKPEMILPWSITCTGPDIDLSLFENFLWKFWLHFEFPSFHLKWEHGSPILYDMNCRIKFSSSMEGCMVEVYGEENSAEHFLRSFREWQKLQPPLTRYSLKVIDNIQYATVDQKTWILSQD